MITITINHDWPNQSSGCSNQPLNEVVVVWFMVLQYLQRCEWCWGIACDKFRRVVVVDVGVVAGNPPDEVNVLAVELVCQLRYQCGLYSKTLARCFAIQVANAKHSRPEPYKCHSHA